MRAYFKNDLYNFAAQRDKERENEKRKEEDERDLATKNKEEKRRNDREKKRNVAEREDSRTRSKAILSVDDSLTIDVEKNEKKEKDLITENSEDMEELMKSFQKKKVATEPNQQNKNIFANGYKPKSSLVVKQEVKDTKKTEKQENLARKNQFISYRKMQNEIKKLVTEQQGKDETNKGEKKPEQGKEQQKKYPQEKEKTKKIKKVANYVRLDLKRKYKDRFLGGLHSNLRKFTKNGRLRPKFRAQSELTLEDGEIYNSYISSLSSALVMTLNIHEDSDHDCDSQPESEQNVWVTPQVFNKENLTESLKKHFGFQYFREGQFETIENILNGKSTLFISETASGKSLTYILGSLIRKGLSLVISPLVSLMLDQLAHLPKNLPAACISSLVNREQRERIINLVKQGKINLLFLTPECLQTDFIYNLEDFPEVNFTCIDEAHSLSELSHNFRTSFLALGDIVLNIIKYKNNKPTILGLTATANPETVQSIKQKLEIEEIVRSSNCMNKNLFVTISKQKGVLKYAALIDYLNDPLIMQCQGILVYTRTRRIMDQVFNFITNSVTSPATIYHSALSNKQKTETLKKFREGTIKIVVATVALGMGLDFSNLECVVHLNMPKSIENYVQEIGRAGRRQRRAYCHLFLDENDYITERNYIIADEIEPSLLTIIYQFLKENSNYKETKKKVSQRMTKLDEELVIKRATILMAQCQREEQIIYEEDEEQYESDESANIARSEHKKVNTRLFAVRVEKLKERTKLREEAILTLLLKIQSLLKTDEQVRLKVLPVANEIVKLGFFRNNQQQVIRASPFFQKLIKNCRKANGTIYINLIDKCNDLELKPIQLLTKLYRLSHQYTMKVELDIPIFVWQFEGRKTELDGGIEYELSQLVEKGFEKLMSHQYVNRVITEMNDVQRVSLVKLNILWSLAFIKSKNSVANILRDKKLLPRNQPIVIENISKQFDNYFKSSLQGFYNQLTANGTEIYIPTTLVDHKDMGEIYGCVELFFKHELANEGELHTDKEVRQARRRLVGTYEDGKIITKILMGVNSGEVHWKIYGERNYWMLFKLKNYSELLDAVREMIAKYKQKYFTSQ